MSNAFDEQALLAKSKVFVERGLVARDQGDFGLFHMWAALALELLGKSALAHVHPTLVADPTKFNSLLAACGRLDTDDVRSIAAKTVYERLRVLSKQYDQRAVEFCVLMANRRNEELHSGASPTGDLKPDVWVPEFWRIVAIILDIRGQGLPDFVGEAEAKSALVLINDSSRVVEEAVVARIRRCVAEFERKYPPQSSERQFALEAAERAFWPTAMSQERIEFDSHDKHECPACKCKGWLFGYELETHHEEPKYDDEGGWVQLVDTVYSSEAFTCPTCGLRLSGRRELDAAQIAEEFTKTEAAEPDYEPDYGND